MALFALEVGDALAARSLECAYASALSVVNQSHDMAEDVSDAVAESGRTKKPVGKVASKSSLAEESSARLRSQLMSMYFKVGTLPRHQGLLCVQQLSAHR